MAQDKLQEALDAYQQDLEIRKRLAEQDKSNSGWQRDLIVTLYKFGITTAKIGTQNSVSRAREFLRTALNTADKYFGPDRQEILDALNQTLQNLLIENRNVDAENSVTPTTTKTLAVFHAQKSCKTIKQ